MKHVSGLIVVAFVAAALAQSAPTGLSRVRGTLEDASAATIIVRDASGARHALPAAADLAVSEVAPIDPASLQPGVFLGTTAVPGADGSLSAVEVHVFPESQRGRGEGHRPMEGVAPGATMTNGTVAMAKSSAAERTMVLRYADGEKTVRVPEGVPVVLMTPGSRALLVPGAKVTVTTQVRDGRDTALRVIVGHDGYVPPF